MTVAAAAAAALSLSIAVPGARSAATAAGPVAAVSVAPAKLEFASGERRTVTLMNHGATPVLVRVRPTGIAVDARGRPYLSVRPRARRNAAHWLSPWPSRVLVLPRRSRSVDVVARLPPGAEPGDHHAALVFTTAPARPRGIGVRMRLVVRVLVRAPGTTRRSLRVRSLRVRRAADRRLIEVRLVNRGNVTEPLTGRTTVRVRGDVSPIRALHREVLPGREAVIAGRYVGRVRGWVLALVRVRGAGAWLFRVRL